MPIQARQNGGTPLVKGCTIYTKAYFAKLAFLKYFSIVSKDVAINESQIGSPAPSHGNTKPTNLSDSESYSILDMTRVASSPTETTIEALKFSKCSSSSSNLKLPSWKRAYSVAIVRCTVRKQGRALDRLLEIKLYDIGPQKMSSDVANFLIMVSCRICCGSFCKFSSAFAIRRLNNGENISWNLVDV